MIRLLATIALLASCAHTGYRPGPYQPPDHFMRTIACADVYRSANPRGAEWAFLADMWSGKHVTVLKFNCAQPAGDETSDDGAAAVGFDVVDLCTSPRTDRILSFASTPDFARFEAIVAAMPEAPASDHVWLIHCENGNDRTGWAAGYVDWKRGGMTKADAFEREMLDRGFHDVVLPGLTEAWRDAR